MLQVRKVIEHVYEKVIGQGSDGGSQTTSGAPITSGQMNKTAEMDKDEEMSSLADEKVELLCNDQASLSFIYVVFCKQSFYQNLGLF